MNADPLASIYRSLEYLAFGRALERCRIKLLEAAPGRRRVLIIGEGDGRFLSWILACTTHAKVDVIDSSQRMLDLAKSKIQPRDMARVRLLRQDALRELPEATYDTIVTNFFLDCLTEQEVNQFVPAVSRLLEPGGVWLVGDFHLPERGLRRFHAQVWLTVMYRFFAMTTGLRARRIPDYVALMKGVGLTVERERYWRAGMITAQVWRRPTAPSVASFGS